MNNLLESFKRFFKNKNTVTIIGVIVILVLLYIGYSSQINKAVNPVTVYVATETIQPRTEITSDMVQTIDMPNISVSEDVLLSRDSIVGRYSNINSVIPKGSMFFKDMVVDKQDLPDAPFMKLKEGNVAYNFPVDMQTTYGNSIFPGKFVDIYMKIGNGADEKVMIGKLIENVEVLAVKDSAGRAVFENTSEERTPAMMIIGLSQDHYNLLIKAYYLSDLGVVLYPVPREAGSANQATASTQELKEYIEAHSINIQTITPTNDAGTATDKLLPTATETGGSINKLTITYPKGCGSTYTCTYSKDGGKATTVKKTTQTITYTTNGTLIATVTEKDGTAHTLTTSVPLNANSTTENVG